MKSVQIWRFFWSVFSDIWTEYADLRSEISVFNPNAGKYGPEKSPYLDSFHAMGIVEKIFMERSFDKGTIDSSKPHLQIKIEDNLRGFNPNKAGLFDSNFSGGGQFDAPIHISRKELI